MDEKGKQIAVLEKFWALRAGMASVLDAGGFQVETMESAGQLPNSAKEAPDYALLVLGPGNHCPTAGSAVRRLRRLQPQTPVLVVFDHPNRLEVVQAFRCGAQSCVSRQVSQDEFLDAAKSAVNGRRYLDPSVAGMLCDAVAEGTAELRISERESQVLKLLSEGNDARKIAERLQVSRHTVESHKKSLMRKLGVRSQLELVARARQLHLAI